MTIFETPWRSIQVGPVESEGEERLQAWPLAGSVGSARFRQHATSHHHHPPPAALTLRSRDGLSPAGFGCDFGNEAVSDLGVGRTGGAAGSFLMLSAKLVLQLKGRPTDDSAI